MMTEEDGIMGIMGIIGILGLIGILNYIIDQINDKTLWLNKSEFSLKSPELEST